MRICNIAKLRDDTRLLYKGGTGSSVLIGSGGGNFIKALESYEGNDESLSHHLFLLLLLIAEFSSSRGKDRRERRCIL